MTSKPISVDDGFFNDLSRQPNKNQDTSNDSQERDGSCENGEEQDIPKTKRIACVICRKRKLKCDGGRPKCATCARLGHSCAYDEVRRKSGPKRGYVKALEARLGMDHGWLPIDRVGADGCFPPLQRKSRLNSRRRYP